MQRNRRVGLISAPLKWGQPHTGRAGEKHDRVAAGDKITDETCQVTRVTKLNMNGVSVCALIIGQERGEKAIAVKNRRSPL